MEATQEVKGQESGWEREGEHGVGGESLTIPTTQQVGVPGNAADRQRALR